MHTFTQQTTYPIILFIFYSTSSIVGGRRVNVSLYGHNRTLSGVAPGAWLMNYRYVGATDAFLNVVADDLFGDNPHISSNSWGPLYPIYNSKNGDYSHFVNKK